MPILLDTSVAILVRDGHAPTLTRLAGIPTGAVMSAITLVELESGIFRHPRDAKIRRERVDEMLVYIPVLPFERATAEAYGRIMETLGYSRRKIMDRMIGAHALVRGLPLATLNPADFADIPGLKIEAWSL